MRRVFSHLILAAICSLPLCNAAAFGNGDFTLQIKYSPWGVIDADEDDFDSFNADESYEKYDLDFERSYGFRAIYEPIYIAANRYTTSIDTHSSDARVDTYSIGLGGINYDAFAYNSGLYLLGAIGLGRGNFKYRDSDMNDWEAFVEANAEIGFRIQENLLIGVGGEWQHFGEPGESKANYWNLYFTTGVVF